MNGRGVRLARGSGRPHRAAMGGGRRGLAAVAWLAALLAVGWLVLAAGCAPKPRTGVTVSVVSPDFFGIGEGVARQLTAGFHPPRPSGMRLILTTVVDIDDLTVTSRFGRLLTEALATQLFRHGFGVVEVRKGSEILVKKRSGELMLSRDAGKLADAQQVNGIVVGTYALTPTTVIVNFRLLDAASQAVLSVAGLEIQRSGNINHLLAAGPGGLLDAGLSGYER